MKQPRKYPQKFQIMYFPQDADISDNHLATHTMYETVQDEKEEDAFYNSLNHEANIKLIKL